MMSPQRVAVARWRHDLLVYKFLMASQILFIVGPNMPATDKISRRFKERSRKVPFDNKRGKFFRLTFRGK
jgi:hypothetical protein